MTSHEQPELEAASLDLKLAPPEPNAEDVARRRVLEALGHPNRVTLVVAPAGYGKSRAVSTWARTLDRPLAWLTLDEADRDPSRFWFELAASVWRATGADFPAETLSALRSPTGMAPSVRLTPLLNLFTRGEHGCVVVLDDYHRCSCPETDETLAFLIRFQPPDLHLVITSRARPDLALAWLRADGRVTDVGVDALAFDLDETGAMLASTGVDVDGATTETVQARTDGWPVAVRLAALGLEQTGNVEALRGLDGRSRLVAEYLNQEILAQQSPADVAFIEQTSILERLSGPLCDRVVDGAGSGARLLGFERGGLPMDGLDDQRTWFRYHPLITDEARHRLRSRLPATEVDELHRRASRWFADTGAAELALDHAFLGNETGVAGEIVIELWLDAVNRGEISTVRTWLDRLGPDVIDADPRLAIADAWVGVMSGDLGNVEVRLDAARAAPEHGAEEFPGASSRASAIALVESVYHRLLGRLGDAASAAAVALDIETEPSHRGRARALAYSGATTFWRSQFDDAELELSRAVGAASRFNNHIAHLLAAGYLAMLALERGDRIEARRAIDDARRVMDQNDLGYHPASAPAYTALAILTSHDDPDASLAAFDRAQAVAAIQREPALLAYQHLARAKALTALGRDGEADRQRYEATAIVRANADVGFVRARSGVVAPSPTGPTTDITERELAVLRMLTTALSAAEIANELFVSHNTVKTQIRSLYRKLGVSRRPEAVRVGTELGLI